MSPSHGEDLGHGVYASPGDEGDLIVSSPRLELGWRVAEGRVPGTGVLWGGKSYEVVSRVEAGRGSRWKLRGWDDPTAMRNVFKLDRDSIQGVADSAELEARGRLARGWTLAVLPVLGLAPAALQKKWSNEWGFAAGRATMVSAILEMLAGGAGTVQLAAAAFGADFFMPPALAVPGPLLFISGCGRLVMVFGDGEPVGSILGAPFLLLVRKSGAQAEQSVPALRLLDEAKGVLVLVSPVLRRDWDRDGILRYRGQRFRFDGVGQEGRSWVYRFIRADGHSADEPALRLRPPRPTAPVKPAIEEPPSFLRTMLMTAAVTLGPASDQVIWAKELGINPRWLTVMGGAAELVGGVANLMNDLGSAHPWLALLDFFLVGEGLLRLGSALTGRPMGSTFGWIIRPLYRRWLPADKSNH